MAKLSNHLKWETGTPLVYTTEAQQLVWKGQVVEQDGDWRRIRWEQENFPTGWLRVSRLDERAKKLTEQKLSKVAEKPSPARKPRPARSRKGVGPEALKALLSLDEADTKAWTD